MKKFIVFILCLMSLTTTGQTLEEKWLLCTNVNCQILDSYYEDGATFTWDGNVVNGKADGEGKAIRTINGEYHSTYEGMYIQGIRQGKGIFTHKDGSILECDFVNNQACGQGKWTTEDGSIYEGSIINYRRHGKGKQIFANGTIQEGFFVSDDLYDGTINLYDGKKIYLHAFSIVDTPYQETTETYNPPINTPITEYFDKNWKRCAQKDASYYRRVTYKAPNMPKGIIKDYYINGLLQSDFYAIYIDYNDDNKSFHEGEAHWYYENGALKEHRYYFNNHINGPNRLFYENGQMYSLTTYEYGVKQGEYFLYYPSGKLHYYALYNKGVLVENKYVELDENGKGSLVYNEFFYKHKDKWAIHGENNSSTITTQGVSLISTDNRYSCKRSVYIPFDQRSDYIIEATICNPRGNKKAEYGIIFGYKDWDNYYQFIINGAGQYYVNGKYEGISSVIRYLTAANSVIQLSEDNHLKIFKLGNKFTFFVNGKNIGTAPATNLRGNEFGIIAKTSGEYILKELSVREYCSITNPQDAYPIEYIPKKTLLENSSSWKASGTGFFINENGYVVTNYHVIDNMKVIQVEYQQDGKKITHNAEIVVSDPTNDLVILKIKDDSFVKLPQIPYVFTAHTEDVGTEVFSLGYPKTQKLGNEIKFTDGKISAKTGVKGDIRLYQISVPITYGNSGGPLFDIQGNLVGITSSGWDNENNINYAIKSIYLQNLVDVLPENISLPNYSIIAEKQLTEKIKILSDYVTLILVK